MEILKLVEDDEDNLFTDDSIIPPGFIFLVKQALAAYNGNLIFDAIYKTTDASKLLACDKTDNSDGASSTRSICGLLSEALCGLAMDIGDASTSGEAVTSPTLDPSSGATTTVATALTSPPTTAARPAQA